MFTHRVLGSFRQVALVYFVAFGALPSFAPPETMEGIWNRMAPEIQLWGQQAQALAESRPNDKVVTPLHFLAVLEDLELSPETKTKLETDFSADLFEISDLAHYYLDNDPQQGGARTQPLVVAQQVFDFLELAGRRSAEANEKTIGADSFARALSAQTGAVHDVLVRAQLRKHPSGEAGAKANKVWKLEDFKVIEGTRNISLDAFMGKNPPVVGQAQIVTRAYEVMVQPEKNNVVLLGEAGTGKSTAVMTIAWEILNHPEEAPEEFRELQIFEIDLTSLQGDTTYRGQFEKKLNKTLAEITAAGGAPFFDEIHRIAAMGGEGGNNLGNMLKTKLTSRELITFFGATTPTEYKDLEKDPALERRLQGVLVAEPGTDATVAILRLRAFKLGFDRDIEIDYRALPYIERVARENLPHRHSPDAPIQVFNGAFAKVVVGKLGPGRVRRELEEMKKQAQLSLESERQQDESPLRTLNMRRYQNEINALDKKIDDLDELIQQNRALRHPHAYLKSLERLGEISDEERGQLKQYAQAIRQFEDEHPEFSHRVHQGHADRAIGDMLRMDSDLIGLSPAARSQDFRKRLAETFIGNEDAYGHLADTLEFQTDDLAQVLAPKKSRLLAVLGIVGPEASEVVPILAKSYIGAEDRVINIAGGDFSDDWKVDAYFKGAPAGYKGYGDGAVFTNKIKAKPRSVILIENIEDANPRSLPTLISYIERIVSDGFLIDDENKRAECRNSIVVITSQLSPEEFAQRIGTTLMESLNGIVQLHTLNSEEVERVVDREIKRVVERLDAEKMIELTLENSVREELIRQAKAIENPTPRAIQTLFGPASPFMRAVISQTKNLTRASDRTGYAFAMKVVVPNADSEIPGRPQFHIHQWAPPAELSPTEAKCAADMRRLAAKEEVAE